MNNALALNNHGAATFDSAVDEEVVTYANDLSQFPRPTTRALRILISMTAAGLRYER